MSEALLIITDNAVNKVAELIKEEEEEGGSGSSGLFLRVYITGGGCSGFQYGFSFDKEIGEGDTVVEKEGVKVVVDSVSFQYLTGAEIDYESDIQGEQFIIRNPHAKTTCGCGSSFAV